MSPEHIKYNAYNKLKSEHFQLIEIKFTEISRMEFPSSLCIFQSNILDVNTCNIKN